MNLNERFKETGWKKEEIKKRLDSISKEKTSELNLTQNKNLEKQRLK